MYEVVGKGDYVKMRDSKVGFFDLFYLFLFVKKMLVKKLKNIFRNERVFCVVNFIDCILYLFRYNSWGMVFLVCRVYKV